jgi:hypothetical protein
VGFEGHRPYYKDSACSSPLLLPMMSSNNRGDLKTKSLAVRCGGSGSAKAVSWGLGALSSEDLDLASGQAGQAGHSAPGSSRGVSKPLLWLWRR